ncbi:MAG: hypothetical protein NVS9B15_02860 [Acidobacteriaceae bacterium]
MESSPGCWAAYGDVLAREYGDITYFGVHQLTVDAYAVQHPGRPSPQSVQSVALHLFSLYLILERGYEMRMATSAIQAASKNKRRFTWLAPPKHRGAVTVADIRGLEGAVAHNAGVRKWAESAWLAWAEHHQMVKSWLL